MLAEENSVIKDHGAMMQIFKIKQLLVKTVMYEWKSIESDLTRQRTVWIVALKSISTIVSSEKNVDEASSNDYNLTSLPVTIHCMR